MSLIRNSLVKKALLFLVFISILILYISYTLRFSAQRNTSQNQAIELSLATGEKISFEIQSKFAQYPISPEKINKNLLNTILEEVGYPNLEPTFKDLENSQTYAPQTIKIIFGDIESLSEEKKQLLVRKTLNQGKIVSGMASNFDAEKNILTYWHYHHSSFFDQNNPNYASYLLTNSIIDLLHSVSIESIPRKDAPNIKKDLNINFNDPGKLLFSFPNKTSLKEKIQKQLSQLLSPPIAYAADVCGGQYACAFQDYDCKCSNGSSCFDGTTCADGNPCSCTKSGCSGLSTYNCNADSYAGCMSQGTSCGDPDVYCSPSYETCVYIPPAGPTATLAPGVTPSPTPAGTSPPGSAPCNAFCSTTADCALGTCAPGNFCYCPGVPTYGCMQQSIKDNLNNISYTSNFSSCLPLTTDFTHTLVPYNTGYVDATHFEVEVGPIPPEWWLHDPPGYQVNFEPAVYSTTFILSNHVPFGEDRKLRASVTNNGISTTDWCPNDILVTNYCPSRAVCRGYEFPTSMYAGQTSTVALTMKNGGAADVWSNANNFKLGSSDPQDNTRWGISRVLFPDGVTVPFLASHEFIFQITAPSTIGTYSSKWQVLKEGISWYDDQCGPDVISVLPGCPSNLQTQCSGTTLTTTWTSGPAGVTNYNNRYHHDYTNNNECLNGATPVEWYCPDQGDQAYTLNDINPSSGNETNTQIINITPGVDYRLTVNSVQPNAQLTPVQGCGVEVIVNCPTPTPAIQGNIYLDEGAVLSPNICTQTGTSYANPVGNLSISSEANTGVITNNQTYSVNTDTYGNHQVTLDISGQTDLANAYICACPANPSNPLICSYGSVASPQTNVNFYLSRYNLSNGSWWQASGGNVYGKNGITSYIPTSTCEELNNCYPALMAKNPFNSAMINTVGFPMVNTGNITTHDSETHIHTPNSNTSDNGMAVGTTLFEQKYNDFISKLSTQPTVITDLNFSNLILDPSKTNFFLYNNSITINETHNWNIPSGTKVVVFVNGDLTLEDSTSTTADQIITVESGGYLAFVVSQNIIIDSSIGYDVANNETLDPTILAPNIEGVFIANGILRTETQAPTASDKKIVFAGTFVGWGGVELNRSFEVQNDLLSVGRNNTNAIETFVHRPDLVINTPIEMKSAQAVWQEVAPNY